MKIFVQQVRAFTLKKNDKIEDLQIKMLAQASNGEIIIVKGYIKANGIIVIWNWASC